MDPQRKQRFFDRWAPTYDWLLPSIFYQAIHQRILDYVQLPAPCEVLDLGCGTGRLLDRLATQFPQLQGTGLDFSAEMIHEARQKNRHPQRLRFVEGNAEGLPFAPEEFQAVFNTISFLHYPHPEQVMAEVARVLVPGGQFYLADFTLFKWQESSAPLAISPDGIRFYSPQLREEFGAKAGLQCRGHYYLLGPVLLTVLVKN